MYDVRFGEFPRLRASVAKQVRRLSREDDARTVAPKGTYVRGTIFDVRFGEFPRETREFGEPDREQNCGATGGSG